jgi:hypothetical protein
MSCTVLLTHDRRPIFPMFNLKFNMMLYRIFRESPHGGLVPLRVLVSTGPAVPLNPTGR